MSSADDFLIEVGTEELPPKALRSLMEAFGAGLGAAIDEALLDHGAVHFYASPRRLAVIVDDLARRQEDRAVEHKGPPISVAFDKDGKPTPAAVAFARKCGAEIEQLGRSKTDKGEWLTHASVEEGKTARALLPPAGRADPGLATHSPTHALGRWRRRIRASGALDRHAAWQGCH